MLQLDEWVFDIFQRYQEEFEKETTNLSQAILLCYICCASEMARIKSGAKWFTRNIVEISADLDLSDSSICMALGVLRGAMMIKCKKVSVGSKMRLLLRVESKVIKRLSFIEDEIKNASNIDDLVKELIPMDEMVMEIKNCFEFS